MSVFDDISGWFSSLWNTAVTTTLDQIVSPGTYEIDLNCNLVPAGVIGTSYQLGDYNFSLTKFVQKGQGLYTATVNVVYSGGASVSWSVGPSGALIGPEPQLQDPVTGAPVTGAPVAAVATALKSTGGITYPPPHSVDLPTGAPTKYAPLTQQSAAFPLVPVIAAIGILIGLGVAYFTVVEIRKITENPAVSVALVVFSIIAAVLLFRYLRE